jgi:hypothetical protein
MERIIPVSIGEEVAENHTVISEATAQGTRKILDGRGLLARILSS